MSIKPVLFDLKENKGNLAFIKITKINAKAVNTGLEITNGFRKTKCGCFNKIGRDPINNAIAGVGNPINVYF